MSFSLVYLVQRFFYRIIEFLRHWYVGGFWVISHKTINLLERLDRGLAFKVTLRHFFKPLYQDYTLIGYILGFIFRSLRLFLAGIVYLIIILVSTAIYLSWALLLPYIIARIFKL